MGALLWAEGFENNETEYNLIYEATFGTGYYRTTGGHLNNGGYGEIWTGTNRFSYVNFPETGASFGVGACVGRRQSASTNPVMRLAYTNAQTEELTLTMTATNLLQLKRGSTVLGTGTTVINDSGWHYIYMEVVLHNSAGRPE